MLPGYSRRPEEPEANEFAGELLMPEVMFREQLDPVDMNLSRLENISSKFRTSISATLHRIVDVAVHITALVRSENGVMKSFHLGHDFPFRVREMRTMLDKDTCAGQFFKDGVVKERESDVPADAWIEDERLVGGETIRELTFPMPNYNSAISLLWVVPGSDLDHLAAG